MQCTFLYFLRAYCLATRGGVMWRASYEWSYNLWMDISRKPSKAQTFVYWVRRCVKDWNGTEHGRLSALFLKSSLSSPLSLSVNILLSLSGWLNVCPSLLITPVSSTLLLFCPFISFFSLFHSFPRLALRVVDVLTGQLCLSRPLLLHHSLLALAPVNFCLVPTVKFNLKYLRGLLLLKELQLSKGSLWVRAFSFLEHI